MVPPTVRRLLVGEAVPGQLVEHLGDTEVAFDDLPDETRLIYAGHPGRVDKDWEEPYGGHVVVKWFGIEDTEESSESSGYGWDERDRTYPGLGWIDQPAYDARVRRIESGHPPLPDEL
jgi:hypothetical protein